jgi:hypothetical protein
MKEVDIPKIFKTYISEEHFSHCISCGRYLLDENSEYAIEKIIKDEKVEIEYAMCFDCINEMRKMISEESNQRINEYFEKNFDFMAMRHNLLVNESEDINDYISNCIFKGISVHDLNEYQLVAHCKGDKLQLSVFPSLLVVM